MENSGFWPAYIYRALCFFAGPRQPAVPKMQITTYKLIKETANLLIHEQQG
jgi:hypothetical protein